MCRLRPSSPRKARSFSRRSGGGPSCTRYRAGTPCFCRNSAVATLAASMHSSISLWASLRTVGRISAILRSSPKMMRVSWVSKSIAPRV
ncbi:hypothetical protein D3C76_867740 [compost metagenome]